MHCFKKVSKTTWNKISKSVNTHNAVSHGHHIQSSVDLGNLQLDYDFVGINTPVNFMKQMHEIESKVAERLNELREMNKLPT